MALAKWCGNLGMHLSLECFISQRQLWSFESLPCSITEFRLPQTVQDLRPKPFYKMGMLKELEAWDCLLTLHFSSWAASPSSWKWLAGSCVCYSSYNLFLSSEGKTKGKTQRSNSFLAEWKRESICIRKDPAFHSDVRRGAVTYLLQEKGRIFVQTKNCRIEPV